MSAMGLFITFLRPSFLPPKAVLAWGVWGSSNQEPCREKKQWLVPLYRAILLLLLLLVQLVACVSVQCNSGTSLTLGGSGGFTPGVGPMLCNRRMILCVVGSFPL